MEFKIECPWCNQHYSVDDSFIGQNVKCSVCEKDFVVKKPNDPVVVKQIPYIQNTYTSQSHGQEQTGFGTQNPGNTQQQVVYIQVPANQKSRGIYVMLGLFLGCFGFHDFYAGHIGRGVAHLVLVLWFSVGFLVRLSRIEGDYAQYDVASAVQSLVISWLVNIVWVIIELIVIKKDGKGNPME